MKLILGKSLSNIVRHVNWTDIIIILLMIIVTYIPVYIGLEPTTFFNKKKILAYSILLIFALSYYSNLSHASFNKNIVLPTYGLAFIFSQFVLLGESIALYHDWSQCFSSLQLTILWLSRSIILTFIFHKLITIVIYQIGKTCNPKQVKAINYRKFFCLIISVKLCWFALFFPCLFDFDSAFCLHNSLQPWLVQSNHNPYLVQLIHRYTFIIGEALGSPSIGFALLSLINIVITTLVLLYALSVFSKADINPRHLSIIAYVFALFPFFPYLSIYITKDGLFSYAFLLYLTTIFEIYLSKGFSISCKRLQILHAISIIAICLFRNQGIYIVIPTSVALFILYHKSWGTLSKSILPGIIIVFLFTGIYLPSQGVIKGSKGEIFGMLFQQTALHSIKYGDDVTLQEKQKIEKVCYYDSLAKYYKYNITDPVKETYCYKYNPMLGIGKNGVTRTYKIIDNSDETSNLITYMSAWLPMFLRHPLTYIEASWRVFADFFYDNNVKLMPILELQADNPWASSPEYRFWKFEKFYFIYDDLYSFVITIPIIGLMFTLPYYNWIFLTLMLLLVIKKDWRGIGIFLPAILSYCLLFLCPVVSARYMYPIIMSLPIMFVYILHTNNSHKNEENSCTDTLLQ